MKGQCEVLLVVACLLGFVGSSIATPVSSVQRRHQLVEGPRGVGGLIGFPALFHDIKHQFGSIGHDIRKLVTSLMGATQVVYWKPPFRRQPLRRADYSHRQQTLLNRISRVTTTTGQPTTRRTRRKKAYTSDDNDDDFDVFDDFLSFDSLDGGGSNEAHHPSSWPATDRMGTELGSQSCAKRQPTRMPHSGPGAKTAKTGTDLMTDRVKHPFVSEACVTELWRWTGS
uniref:Secreted protein n=1 Tax=Anopheles farauti TaxID=69004 RepID=A0A182QLD3_9DIPT